MKKKLVIFVSLIVCSLALLLALPACDNPSNGTSNGDCDLQYDKKYIYLTNVNNDKDCYYLFLADGTGFYRYYHKYEDSLFEKTYIYDYTVNFKYTYADNDKSAVVCLFDSVEYGSTDNTKEVKTNWSILLTVSKNVLCTTSGSFYINEDYLKEIPNFNS